jgi:hypothetical protein
MTPIPADSLRTVLARVFDDPAFRWVEPADPLAFLRQWWQLAVDSLSNLSLTHPMASRILVAVLVVILVAILVHGCWIVIGTLRGAAAGEQVPMTVRTVEAHDAAWHRRQAMRLSREGRFAEALFEEFWALVRDLEVRRLVRFHPSKTPGEYVFDPDLGAADRARLGALVERLYALVFAGRECRADDVVAWRAAAAEEWGAGAF